MMCRGEFIEVIIWSRWVWDWNDWVVIEYFSCYKDVIFYIWGGFRFIEGGGFSFEKGWLFDVIRRLGEDFYRYSCKVYKGKNMY